jgi:hypothetical protein
MLIRKGLIEKIRPFFLLVWCCFSIVASVQFTLYRKLIIGLITATAAISLLPAMLAEYPLFIILLPAALSSPDSSAAFIARKLIVTGA